MGRRDKKDLFPVYLALSVAVLGAATVGLSLAAHPIWAIVTGVASALVALPLSGWIVAGPFLEADVVVTISASGGQMLMAQLVAAREPDDRLITHLTRNGVISVADGSAFLHKEKIGRILAFFIRLRLTK